MSSFFYGKIALNNIKRNSKTYIPFILTCVGAVSLFYNMYFLSVAKDIGSVSDNRSLRLILRLGAVVVGIFSLIFLFYTNSFLIKQRKKEFGLFNVLGMEKKHIARVMFYETLMTGTGGIVTGVLLGILVSKLMILLLLKIVKFKATFGFEVPVEAIGATVILFGAIFILNLVYNYSQVHRTKPAELLKSPNLGEREPKTKWFATIVGVLSLGAGYYIALTTESPLVALNIFFFAVILVIIGTYCLFTAGSIAFLKMLRKNKKYYYRANHFASVSGMIYRMKQNAVGLSNICILSTAVIIMLSTTFSLYIGMEDELRNRYPRNIMVSARNVPAEKAEELNRFIGEQVESVGANQKNIVYYRYMSFIVIKSGQEYVFGNSAGYAYNNSVLFTFITQEDYNRMENAQVSLDDNEMLLYAVKGKIPGDDISFNGLKFSIREHLSSFSIYEQSSSILAQSNYAVVKDTKTIRKVYSALNGDGDMGELSYYYGFDTDAEKDTQIELVRILRQKLGNVTKDGFVEGAEHERDGFYTIYGGLFFLGIFLGLLFIMATVLIIYYKQIAEGFDDRDRFNIMQKVGMSRKEIWKSVRSQVLTVFFIPLGAAIVHLAFAFKVITRLLLIFNLTNILLYAGCTLLVVFVFAVFYTAVYSLTARTYYRIVSA